MADCEDTSMTCPKCGYIYADTLPSCPHCGQAQIAQPSQRDVQTMVASRWFLCICIMMTAAAFLYLCSGRLAPFWICFAVAGWIARSGNTSQKQLKSGLNFYSVVLKILQYLMLALAALFVLLAAAILIVGFFTGDTWLTYLAGISTEYGTDMVPVAALGRLLGAVVSFGDMLAVGSAAIALIAIAAVFFLTAKLLIPIRRYVYGLLRTTHTENTASRRAFHADVSFMIFGIVHSLYAAIYINHGSTLGCLASLFAAASLFLLAWMLRKERKSGHRK